MADGRGRYDRWHLARADARDAGSVPSIRMTTVREWAAAAGSTPDPDRPVAEDLALAPPATIAIHYVTRSEEEGRQRGAGFGSLVHGVLAQAPFDAAEQTLDNLAGIEARMLGLSSDDAAAAAGVAARVLAHDLLVRAKAADVRGACRRETPITYRLADGTFLEGIVDLAFEDRGAWTVVDYKTDFELAALGADQYRLQVAAYASAIARATGAPCRGIVLVV